MVGTRIAEIRKLNNDTQAELAENLSVSISTVRSWEQGNSSPNVEMLANICRLYSVSSDYLLGLSSQIQLPKRETPFMFNDEEQIAINEYKAFLVWKKKRKNGK